MKRIKNLTSILSLVVMSLFITSCGGSNTETDDTVYLHVYNWQDYIYQYDPDNGYEEKDMVDQFEDYINADENKAKYGLTKNVSVIYDTFDTNETMYNELKLNKSSYDLICPSDYMIQKLALNLANIDSCAIQKIDYDKVPNYKKYVSKFLTEQNMDKVLIDETDSSKGVLSDYALGYMWGTLGILYNPSYGNMANAGYDEETVISDFTQPNSWDVLWENSTYASSASIKDSIRDTYAMGIMHVYSDEFKEIYEQHENGTLNDSDYHDKVSELFNKCDDTTIDNVGSALKELKNDIYGFEVDTGKTDIVTGKVGVNLAWSGDAVYSMDQAEEQENYLYYALPSYGANIWFDGWCIPESVTGEHLSAAYAFLDFISSPSSAAMNMDYIGYTPFIAGDDVLSLVHDWYDSDDETDVVSEPYDLSYFFEGTLENADSDPEIYCYTDQVERQLHAQYPQEKEISHLAMMKDFGRQNDKVVTMWEDVKVNPLPIWVTIIVIVALVGGVAYLGSYRVIKKYRIKKRKALREK